MSTETLEQEVKEVKAPKESLFSTRRKKFVTDPLDDSNPVVDMSCALLSGLCIAIAMNPIDVVRTRLMAQQSQSNGQSLLVPKLGLSSLLWSKKITAQYNLTL